MTYRLVLIRKLLYIYTIINNNIKKNIMTKLITTFYSTEDGEKLSQVEGTLLD